jgi:tetratricopeptide (TPR) repeat protein
LYAGIGDTAGVAHSHNGLAIARMAVRDYVRASAHYERALALYTEVGDSKRVANTLNNMGIMHREAGSLAAALACLRKSMALYRVLGDADGESKCLFDTAEVERDLGRISRGRNGDTLLNTNQKRVKVMHRHPISGGFGTSRAAGARFQFPIRRLQ